MKITQYCSVCKQSLEMEVVSTDEADDDGVIWLRCPQCQGYLPRIGGEGLKGTGTRERDATRDQKTDPPTTGTPDAAETDAPARARRSRARDSGPDLERDEDADDSDETAAQQAERERRHLEYVAQLAEKDPESAVPYRPWNTYEVGDLVHHLAWDDVGIVVAKETLPGNRRVVEVFFEDRGVVRLIEASGRKP